MKKYLIALLILAIPVLVWAADNTQGGANPAVCTNSSEDCYTSWIPIGPQLRQSNQAIIWMHDPTPGTTQVDLQYQYVHDNGTTYGPMQCDANVFSVDEARVIETGFTDGNIRLFMNSSTYSNGTYVMGVGGQ